MHLFWTQGPQQPKPHCQEPCSTLFSLLLLQVFATWPITLSINISSLVPVWPRALCPTLSQVPHNCSSQIPSNLSNKLHSCISRILRKWNPDVFYDVSSLLLQYQFGTQEHFSKPCLTFHLLLLLFLLIKCPLLHNCVGNSQEDWTMQNANLSLYAI